MAKEAQSGAAWSESINVAGVSIEGGTVDIPKGLYKCKTVSVTKSAAKSGSGNNVLKYGLQVVAPKAQAGTKLQANVTLAENTKFVLKRALLSHGIAAASLEKGEVKIGEKTFVGKECYVSFAPAPEGEKYYAIDFVTADQFAASAKSKPNGATKAVLDDEEAENASAVDDADGLL